MMYLNATNQMVNVPYLDLLSENSFLKETFQTAFNDVLDSGQYILSDKVSDFESQFASFCNADYCVGVNSGLDALVLILKAYNIGSGDEVIVPVNSFVATALAVSHVGARPVFCDVDPQTFNLDPRRLASLLSKNTKAVIGVHLYGHPFDISEIKNIIANKNIYLIEDAAQAHGAFYKGQSIGALSDAAAFSFYPTKNIGALGDAGCIVTNDKGLQETLISLRNYGSKEKYHHSLLGYNSRLSCIQAALLSCKLPYYPDWLQKRRQISSLYQNAMNNKVIHQPTSVGDVTHAWHVYAIHTRYRDELQSFLAENGIGSNIHYPVPIHLQPCYHHLKYKEGDFPVAERLAKETLSLPLYACLTELQINHVINTINAFVAP